MIKKFTTVIFTVFLCSISYVSMTNSGGPGPQYSNAPKEGNCTSCHSGSLVTSGTDWNKISLSSKFTGNGYIPDSVYSITIAYNQSGISKWGFQATILDGSSNKAGTISSASGRVNIFSSSSLTRDYAGHSTAGTASTGTNATDWTFTWKAPSKNIGPVNVYLTLNAADNSTSTSGDIIYGKVFTIAPSSLLPVADAKSNDSVTCVGTNITLSGTSTNSPTSWSWLISGATPSSSSAQNPVVKYNSVGTFWAVLTSKNAKGTSKSDSLKIVVKVRPTLSITGATSYTLCKGDSVNLSSTFNVNYAYTWTPSGLVNSSIWAKDTGSYFVSIKDNNRCTNIAGPIKVKHFNSNTVSITKNISNDTICFEKPIKITATGSTTFDSLYYFDSHGYYGKTINNPETFKFSGPINIYAKGKDANGCFTVPSNTLNFEVKNTLSAPVASCSNKTNASFEISWNAVTKALGYEVSLDSGKTWETPTSGSKGLKHQVFGFPPNTDVEVYLKALDIFPCYESPITKIVCGSIPCSPLTYAVIWDKEACKGTDINFKIKNINTNYYSLRIDNGNTFKDTAFKITADFSRTYKFELIDSSNLSCPTIKRDAAVVVWEIPSSVLRSNNTQNVFCEGYPAIFSADAKNMHAYNFFLNDVSKQSSKNANWTLTSPKNLDSVWVEITNGACKSISDKILVGVKPIPVSSFTNSFAGRTGTFKASQTTGIFRYLWSFGDGTMDTLSANPVHKYDGSNPQKVWVKLTVIDQFGCSSSDSQEVNVPSASLRNTLNENGIKIYPQPAKSSFIVDVPNELINAQIIMIDATGRTIIKVSADSKLTEIITSDLPSGVYMLMMNKESRQFNGKVIVTH